MILSIILTILIGAFVGWLAGLVMKSSHGFWVNCLIGIVGSALGRWLANLIGLSGGAVVGFLISLAGSCILILLLRVILGKRF